MRRLRKDKESGPRHHSETRCTAHLVKLSSACYSTQAIGPMPAARTPRLLLMAPFNFQSIQSLEISKEDHPEIDVRDGRLVLTAQRGTERIMITAPIANMIPAVAKRTVKVSGKTKTNNVVSLAPTDGRVGANHASEKLTEADVREIKNILNDRKISKSFKNRTAFYQELGKAYKVHFTTIANIAKGSSWKHVTV